MHLIPCPIPRCALEWFLVVSAIVAGISIWMSGDPRLGHYDIALPAIDIRMNSARWGMAFELLGVMQAAAIMWRHSGPQRLVAGVAAFTWAAFAISAWHGGMVAFAFGDALLAAGGQMYVCAMFRGARWRA